MFIMALNFFGGRNAAFLLHRFMILCAVAALLGCGQPAQFQATDITGASFGRLAGLDSLTDHKGRRVASADFAGKVVVIFFGYTQCPDVCPTTMVTLKEAMRLLGPEAERVQVLFVTLDPERDTREILAAYVPWFDARFLGLYGDAQDTLKVAREFRAFYAKIDEKSAAGYSLDHSSMSYAYDPQGRLRLLIRHGANATDVVTDLRLLLAGR